MEATALRYEVRAGRPGRCGGALLGEFANAHEAWALAEVYTQVRAITHGQDDDLQTRVFDRTEAHVVLAFTDHPDGRPNVRVFPAYRVLQPARVLFTGNHLQCLEFALHWCTSREPT